MTKNDHPKQTLADYTTYQAGMLQSKAYRALRRFISESLAEHGLSMQEWAVLGHVTEAERLPQSAVAGLLGVESPLATTLINSLAKKGLLSRQQDPDDNRARLLIATAKGRQQAARIERGLRASFREWLSDIAPADMLAYIKVLEQIAEKS